ncbi:MAG: hypothetical protein LBU28_05635 [Spirochaetaceae bacterium]|jgi:hypothetical protein|nr:hypothetical protein [Spirochaetaceae bacterium]
MIKLKSLSKLRFLIIFVGLPCIQFGAVPEFTRNIKERELLASTLSRGETSESSNGAVLLISESILLCNQPLIQHKARFNKFLRHFLPLIALAPILKAFSRVTIGKYCLHHYCPLVFLHILLLSLLLGGRAPPRSIRPMPGYILRSFTG